MVVEYGGDMNYEARILRERHAAAWSMFEALDDAGVPVSEFVAVYVGAMAESIARVVVACGPGP